MIKTRARAFHAQSKLKDLAVMKSALVFAALVASSYAQQLPFDYFNFHYGADSPESGFFPQPRTVDEALAAGFERLSGCGDLPTVEGERYGQQGKEDIVLIYDVNGFIAGVQSMIPENQCFTQSSVGSGSYDCAQSPFYTAGDFFGVSKYFITSYFVDVETICTTGRTTEEFETQGTGYILLLQQSTDPRDVMSIPLSRADMDAEMAGLWYTHNCFPNMGTHYLNFNYELDQDCQEIIPFQIIYDMNGDINGVVHQHFAPVGLDVSGGEYWEPVTTGAATAIVASPPQCLLDYALNAEVSSLHMYFRDYHVSCLSA